MRPLSASGLVRQRYAAGSVLDTEPKTRGSAPADDLAIDNRSPDQAVIPKAVGDAH